MCVNQSQYFYNAYLNLRICGCIVGLSGGDVLIIIPAEVTEFEEDMTTGLIFAAPTEELFFTPVPVLNGWCSFLDGLGDGWSLTVPADDVEDNVMVCCVNSRSRNLILDWWGWWSISAAANCVCPTEFDPPALELIPRFDPIIPRFREIGAYTRLMNSSNVLLSLCREETISRDRFRSS